MPRKKQYQPQRLGLLSHRVKTPITVTLATEPLVNEMSCGGDTEDPHRSSSNPRPSLAPPPTPHDLPPTSLDPQGLCQTQDPPSTPSSSRFPQDHGLVPGQSEPGQGPVDNTLDKDLSLSSILALLCGGVNPLQGLGRETLTCPPVGVQGLGRETLTCPSVGVKPGASTLGGHGRMQGGRREGEGDSSPPLGLLPDVPPLSQHALQLSALAQRVAKNSLSSPSSFSFTPPSCAVSSRQPVSGELQGRPAEQDVWPSHRCSWAGKGGRLSPDSAIQRLRAAAANAALHNRSADPSSSPSLSSGGVVLQEEVCLTLDPRPLTSPSSASSTLAALSQKVSQSGPGSKVASSVRSEVSSGQKLSSTSSFLSLLSRSSPTPLSQSSSKVGENRGGLSPEPRPEEETQTRAENQAVPPSPCKNQGSALLPQMESKTKPRSPPLPLDTQVNTSPVGESSPGAQTVVYQCPVCGLQMKRRSYWRRHMSVHTGLKSQQCQLCPFRCARKDNLTAHMKVHIQKEKGEEFQCNLCPFTSPRHFSLKLHMRCHQRPGRHTHTHTHTLAGDAERDRGGKEKTESEGGEQARLQPGCKVDLSPRLLDTSLRYSSCSAPLHSAPVQQELLRQEGEAEGAKEGQRGEVCVKEEPQDLQVSTSSQLLPSPPLSPLLPRPTPSLSPLSPPSLSSLLHSLSPHPPLLAPKRNRRKARTPPHSPSAQKRRTHTPLTHPPLMVPMATSLFSPDISSKTASDLLIKLSEATQKAELKPGSLVKQEAQEEGLVPGQQQQGAEPGLALSPDGPGASPEPPTPLPPSTEVQTERGLLEQDISVTVASELLRRLSEKQEVVVQGLTVKEEEEPMEVDPLTPNMTPNPALTLGGRVEPIRDKDTAPASLIPKEEDLFQKELFSQDISVKMASALLFQLSEKFYKANDLKESRSFGFPVEKKPSAPDQPSPPDQPDPIQPSPDRLQPVGCKYRCPVCSYQAQCQTNLNHHLASHTAKTSGWDYYYRCHMCGFELEGRSQFLGHMMEHSEWERDAFSLRCSVCDHSTNEERAMRLHASSHTLTHTAGETGGEDYPETHLAGSHAPEDSPVDRESPHNRVLRCPLCEFSTNRPVSMVTHMRSSHSTADQHLCCICQRSFPGQPELQAHVRGHRQGNQYRCDRCGHLARTANKLIEHVRVHTGERPFTCDLCPYSAKRRDSLRLHCRLKHPEHTPSHAHTHAGQHTHRSALNHLSTSSSLSSWFRGSDFSPLFPLTTLLSLRPLSRPSSCSPSSPPPPLPESLSSSPLPKLSFLAYLGLTEQT